LVIIFAYCVGYNIQFVKRLEEYNHRGHVEPAVRVPRSFDTKIICRAHARLKSCYNNCLTWLFLCAVTSRIFSVNAPYRGAFARLSSVLLRGKSSSWTALIANESKTFRLGDSHS